MAKPPVQSKFSQGDFNRFRKRAENANARAKDNLKVAGIGSLRSKLAMLPDEVRKPFEDAIKRAAEGVRRDARKNIRASFKKRTGGLIKNIGIEYSQDKLAANIGIGKGHFYGVYLEFGTRTGIPRSRWLQRAFWLHKKRLKKNLRNKIRKTIRQHSRK